MVRWDSPLFTLPWDEEDIAADAIWRALTEGAAQVPNAGTAVAPKAPTDALQTLETTTAAIVSRVVAEQNSLGGLGGQVSVEGATLLLPPRNVTLSELQRLKRQFVTVHRKAITQGAVEKGNVDWTPGSIAKKFAEHLQENLHRIS